MGLFSKSSAFHRSERIERVERKVNENPNTANPGDEAPAPKMPMLPEAPVAPESKVCELGAREVNDSFPPPLPTGGRSSGGAAELGTVIAGIISYLSGKSAEKNCIAEQQIQYQKDLAHYNKAVEIAKADFEQKSFEYIQYKRDYDAQQARYLDAKGKARKDQKHDAWQNFVPKPLRNEKKDSSSTRHKPSGTGARNPENDAFPPTGKSPTRSPMPTSDHPYVTPGTPAYHPPDPLEFQWPSQQKQSMTTQYNQAKSSAAPAQNDYWTSYVKEKNTPRYK